MTLEENEMKGNVIKRTLEHNDIKYNNIKQTQ